MRSTARWVGVAFGRARPIVAQRASDAQDMASSLDWDEFRLVKAIADAGSLVGAAEALGLNHSTVFRRLAAIESAVGARLFERSRAGYRPTAAGEEMIGLAGAMADSIVEFERRVAGRDVKPSGELRVTTTDAIAIALLPPILARFHAVNPAVQLDLIVAAQTLNLSRRDADVAIRVANEPPEALVGRRICAMRWAVYCTAEIAAEFGPRVVAAAPWVGFGDHYAPPLGKRWVEDNVGPRRQVARVNSVLGVAEAAALGVGAALLPCFLGDPRPELTRVGAILPELDVDLWILTHADLRQSARVRAFMELAGAELAKMRKTIEGAAGEPG
ncbi:MAG: LysR family transcriptional regulator [Roseiarcus sp.]|jgi:DNA-binding transcriptional LysR family regulator